MPTAHSGKYDTPPAKGYFKGASAAGASCDTQEREHYADRSRREPPCSTQGRAASAEPNAYIQSGEPPSQKNFMTGKYLSYIFYPRHRFQRESRGSASLSAERSSTQSVRVLILLFLFLDMAIAKITWKLAGHPNSLIETTFND